MDLDLMFSKVCAYESTQKHSEIYLSSQFQSQSASVAQPEESKEYLP